MNIETSLEKETDSIFNGGEFVFTKKTDKYGKTEVVGGGYKINSIFLENDIPVLQTMNTDDNEQNGGKVSSPFENLAVPAGLFYINQRVPKRNIDKDDFDLYKKHETLSDDMFDKLFGLVEADKKKQRKTRKHTNKNEKPVKRKTRKNV
jgi:hypothetical protein